MVWIFSTPVRTWLRVGLCIYGAASRAERLGATAVTALTATTRAMTARAMIARALVAGAVIAGVPMLASAASLDAVSSKDASAGLRAAVSQGVDKAIGLLGAPNGFLAN